MALGHPGAAAAGEQAMSMKLITAPPWIEPPMLRWRLGREHPRHCAPRAVGLEQQPAGLRREATRAGNRPS